MQATPQHTGNYFVINYKQTSPNTLSWCNTPSLVTREKWSTILRPLHYLSNITHMQWVFSSAVQLRYLGCSHSAIRWSCCRARLLDYFLIAVTQRWGYVGCIYPPHTATENETQISGENASYPINNNDSNTPERNNCLLSCPCLQLPSFRNHTDLFPANPHLRFTYRN